VIEFVDIVHQRGLQRRLIKVNLLLDPSHVFQQWRLRTRYEKLSAAGKKKPQIVTAVRRELLGSIWATAVGTEAKFKAERNAA
jgi:hypothetical protein